MTGDSRGGPGMNEPLIPKHGGYRKLKSFQVAQLVYDVTVRFCERYIDKRSRTHDQMVQAARSGVQNIAVEVARWVEEQRSGGRSGQGGPVPSNKSMLSTPSTYAEVAANAALVLLAVACSLLDRQISAQAKSFESEGGFTERLHRIRSKKRESP